MITKNSVVKIQNFVVNHESRHVKSNPEYVKCLCYGTISYVRHSLVKYFAYKNNKMEKVNNYSTFLK